MNCCQRLQQDADVAQVTAGFMSCISDCRTPAATAAAASADLRNE